MKFETRAVFLTAYKSDKFSGDFIGVLQYPLRHWKNKDDKRREIPETYLFWNIICAKVFRESRPVFSYSINISVRKRNKVRILWNSMNVYNLNWSRESSSLRCYLGETWNILYIQLFPSFYVSHSVLSAPTAIVDSNRQLFKQSHFLPATFPLTIKIAKR